MKKILAKLFRFVLNVGIYAGVIISVVYYSYMNNPDLIGIKNVIFPLPVAVILSIIVSIILAGANECTTIFMIRLINRGR